MNEDIIDKYINNQLSEVELENFELELKRNPQLQKELDLMRGIRLGAIKQGREENIKHFQNLEKQIALEELDRPYLNAWPWFMKLAVAASIIIALAVSYFFFFHQRPTVEILYSEHFSSYPNYLIENTRGGNENTQNPVYLAMMAYESGKFDLAISELKKVLSANPHNHVIRTYLGLSFLENNQPDVAVVYLQAAWNAKDQEYGNVAGWYLALAWLKMGEIEKSVSILQSLESSEDAFYAKKAKELLDDI